MKKSYVKIIGAVLSIGIIIGVALIFVSSQQNADSNTIINLEKYSNDFYLKNYDKIINEAREDISKSSKNLEAIYFIIGKAYSFKNMPKKAILNYTKALNIKPNAESYYMRALLYLEINNLKEALNDAKKSVNLHKTYSSYFVLGTVFFYSKDPRKALLNLNKSLDSFPIDTTIINTLNKNKLSTKLKNRLKNQQQNDLSEIYLMRALVYTDLNNHENASKDMEKSASLGNLTAKDLVKNQNINN